jgi:hypothetical protein
MCTMENTAQNIIGMEIRIIISTPPSPLWSFLKKSHMGIIKITETTTLIKNSVICWIVKVMSPLFLLNYTKHAFEMQGENA